MQFLRGPKADELDDFKLALELGQKFPGEDKSLAVHADICARRFRAIVVLQKAQYEASCSNRFMMIMLIVFLIVSKVITLDALYAVFSALKNML